MKPKLSL